MANGLSKLITLFLSASLFPYTSYAQAPALQWETSYGGSKSDNATAIINTSDGGYAVAGETISPNGQVTGFHHDPDFWIIKLNADGTLLWQKDIGGNFDDVPLDIVQSNDGGYVAAGETGSNDGDVTNNHGANDFWVVKLSSSGTLVWQHTFGGSGNEDAQALIKTSDGGYLVAGGTKSTTGQVTNNHGATDFWVIKIDGLGNLVWQKTYGNIFSEEAYDIASTADGGFIVAGKTQGINGDLNEYNGLNDYMVVKANANGVVQWQKAYGGTENDEAHAIYQTPDHGYVVGGFSYSTDGQVTGNHGSADYWIIKIDSAGTLVWENSLGGSNTDWNFDLCPSPGGGIIAAGSASSNNGDVTGNNGDADFWILELNSNGTMLWNESFGGTFSEDAHSIIPTPDGGYIAAGANNSFDGDVGQFLGGGDYWVVKLQGTCTVFPKAKITTPSGTDLCNNTVILKAAPNVDYTYQWYKGSGPVAGATDKKYLPATQGQYSYKATSIATGCAKASKKAHVIKSCKLAEGAEISAIGVITIYPNPATETFTINLNAINVSNADFKLMLINTLGEVVYSEAGTIVNGEWEKKISVKASPGLYIVRVLLNGKVYDNKLLLTD